MSERDAAMLLFCFVLTAIGIYLDSKCPNNYDD